MATYLFSYKSNGPGYKYHILSGLISFLICSWICLSQFFQTPVFYLLASDHFLALTLPSCRFLKFYLWPPTVQCYLPLSAFLLKKPLISSVSSSKIFINEMLISLSWWSRHLSLQGSGSHRHEEIIRADSLNGPEETSLRFLEKHLFSYCLYLAVIPLCRNVVYTSEVLLSA